MLKSPRQIKTVDSAELSKIPLIGVFCRSLKLAKNRGRKPCSLAATISRLLPVPSAIAHHFAGDLIESSRGSVERSIQSTERRNRHDDCKEQATDRASKRPSKVETDRGRSRRLPSSRSVPLRDNFGEQHDAQHQRAEQGNMTRLRAERGRQ